MIIRNLFICLIIFFLFLSTKSSHETSSTYIMKSDTTRIKNDLLQIIETEKPRQYLNVEILNQVADYIKTEFEKISDSVSEQEFEVLGNNYKNIICSFGIENTERIIVGAHYDVCGNQPGADDNASGVTGLLELARLISKEKLKYRIDFVAYSLEEPPFFGTENMGSYVHAKYLYDNNIHVKGMICLEMIGYFSDLPDSQQYPIGFFKFIYGKTGDFITVVQKFFNGKFGRKFNRILRKNKTIKTKFFKGPAFIPGVDFSDHLNYWKFGYSAVMITNTSFYRNKNYHDITDTLETLDIQRMALVVDELYLTLKEFNKK